MVDLHSHILPGLDDGSRNVAESVEMARIAAEDGITHMVATPHMFNGLSQNPEPSDVVGRVQALQQEIGDSLTVLPGNEVHIAHDIVEKAAAAKVMSINRKNYMLIELPSMNVPVGASELFDKLQINGITPILVHPERNIQIQNQPSLVEEFIKRGTRIQATAMSITGEFGSSAQRTVRTLLRHNCVHFIATDAHRAGRRPPVLSAGRDGAAEIIGEEPARRLVEDNPRAVIRGDAVPTSEPIPFRKHRSSGFFAGLFRSRSRSTD